MAWALFAPKLHYFKTDMTAFFVPFSLEQPLKEAYTAESSGVSSWTSKATWNSEIYTAKWDDEPPRSFCMGGPHPGKISIHTTVPRAQKGTWFPEEAAIKWFVLK